MIYPIVMINGREYKVTDQKANVDRGGPTYELKGSKGATYYTARAAPYTLLSRMFLVSERGKIVLRGVWLTDEGGTLKQL